MRFEGKVAFITGGAIGFGRAFARALVAEGASAVIADIDGEAEVEAGVDIIADNFLGGGSVIGKGDHDNALNLRQGGEARDRPTRSAWR